MYSKWAFNCMKIKEIEIMLKNNLKCYLTKSTKMLSFIFKIKYLTIIRLFKKENNKM